MCPSACWCQLPCVFRYHSTHSLPASSQQAATAASEGRRKGAAPLSSYSAGHSDNDGQGSFRHFEGPCR